MESLITVHNLYKSFDDHSVLRGLDFEVPRGSILGVVGSTGCGKSTLLRCMAGIHSPAQGFIRVENDPIRQDTPISKKKLSYCADVVDPIDYLTVAEHLEFVARVYQLEKSTLSLNLRRFGIESAGHEMAKALSLGLRKKMGLGCAFLPETPVIILDEPTTGLDTAGRSALVEALKENPKRSVVLSSHDFPFVQEVCTDVLVIENGSVGWYGPSSAFFSEREARTR